MSARTCAIVVPNAVNRSRQVMTPILLIIKLLREGLDRILIPKKSCMQMFSTVLRPFAETRFTDPTLEVGTITRNAGCGDGRSEEHTSELQSLRHLVCRLLLEKKN